MNSLTAAELKRRGMAAIEEGLRHGPVYLVKRNKPSAVILSEEDYARLSSGGGSAARVKGVSALQWLLTQPARGGKHRKELDKALHIEREGWA